MIKKTRFILDNELVGLAQNLDMNQVRALLYKKHQTLLFSDLSLEDLQKFVEDLKEMIGKNS